MTFAAVFGIIAVIGITAFLCISIVLRRFTNEEKNNFIYDGFEYDVDDFHKYAYCGYAGNYNNGCDEFYGKCRYC